MTRTLPSLLLLAAAAVLVSACASDPGSGVPDTGGTGADAGLDTTPGRDLGGDGPIVGYPHLEFVSEQIQRLSADQRVSLDVRYVGGDDRPVVDARLSFEYDELRAGGSNLRSLSATTGDDGVGSVELRAGALAAEFDVVVSVADPEVAPINFVITVVPKDDGDYVITVHYEDGAVTLQEAEVLLFNSRGRCRDVPRLPDEISGAFDQVRMLPLADGSFPPAGYPARSDDDIRSYFPVTYAVAVAYKEDTPVAMGCTDGLPAEVAPGSNTPIDIYMTDLFPAIKGEFRVVNEFDILEFIPGEAQNVVRYIGRFFDSPGHTIFDILADSGVFDGESLPFGIDDLIADAIDALLFAFLPPEAVRIFEVGSDIYDTLQNIQLQGSMIFFEDPDEHGVLGECNELILDEIIVDFDTFDTPTFNLRSYGYQGAYGTFTGWLSVEEEGDIGYALNISQFGLELNYGELAVFILETIVFPNVIGPEVDSMEAFVESFIDCGQIADDVGWSPIETLCDAIINAAVAGLREFLTSQTVDVSSYYILSTPVAGTTPPSGIELLEEGMRWAPCELTVESDGTEQRVEILGGPGRDRCVWNARFRTDETDSVGAPVPAAFDGFRLTTRANGTCGDGE